MYNTNGKMKETKALERVPSNGRDSPKILFKKCPLLNCYINSACILSAENKSLHGGVLVIKIGNLTGESFICFCLYITILDPCFTTNKS